MPDQQNINLTVTKNEALVLFEFLIRFNQKEYSDIFEDQAEQKVLLILEGQLEKVLNETFRPDYINTISKARSETRDQE